jgi:transposase
MRREEFECIGVDVSKKTLDVALFRGKVDWNDGHIKIDNNSTGYKELKKWLHLKHAEKKQLRVCMEATGLYTHDFRTWLEKESITYYVVDSKLMHHFAPPQSIKGIRQTKNDKADAFRIAIYCSLFHDTMMPSKLPSAAYFKLKRLLAERKQYSKQSVLYKQQLHDISIYDTVSSRIRKEEELKNLKIHIKQTDAEILTVLDTDDAIKQNYNLLISIVGVGLVVAVTTIVLTENFTTFTNPRKYASYIAIAPFPHESGTSVRGATKVSKQGFRQAKADLSISVLSAISHDPDIKDYWLRKKTEGKHTGTILNAIKFKLVLRMFAVVKRGTPYVNTKGYKG